MIGRGAFKCSLGTIPAWKFCSVLCHCSAEGKYFFVHYYTLYFTPQYKNKKKIYFQIYPRM